MTCHFQIPRLAAFIALLVFTPCPAAADAATPSPADAPPAAQDPARRVLDGHPFQTSTLIVDPFATSSAGLRVGYRYGSASARALQTDPVEITCCQDLGFGGVESTVKGSVRFGEAIALRFGVDTAVYSGTDQKSVIGVGTGLQLGAHAQVVAGQALGESVRGALAVGLSRTPGLDILVLSALEDAISSGDLGSIDIVRTSSPVMVDAGAAVAWTIVPWAGLMASLQWIGPSQSSSSTLTAAGLAAGAVADFDLRPLVGASFASNVAYSLTAPLGSGEAQHDLRLGFFYTGRPGLTFGGELGWRRWHLRGDELASSAAGLDVVMQYVW